MKREPFSFHTFHTMPIKRPTLITGEIYHIVIRAVEDMNLFRDKGDYFRFIHDLFEFNDENPAISTIRVRQSRSNETRTVLVSLAQISRSKKRKMLIEILAFCLMPNHVHLLIRQIKDGGISKFMRKIGAGYGNYFNKKYERKGHVFQGKFRAVLIKNNEQLKTVFVYIHTNPVSIIIPGWKEKGIQNVQKVIKFLENKYRWSSYFDYLGKKNFPSITTREFLLKIMKDTEGCKEFVGGWLKFKKELADFDDLLIE